EFVHSEQDSLIIRNMADKAQVGKTATADQVKALQDSYKQQAGGNLSEDHLKEVLRARDGRSLSKDEIARAEDLTKSFKDNAPLGDRFNQAKDSWQMTQRELGLLYADKEGARKLIARLADKDSEP